LIYQSLIINPDTTNKKISANATVTASSEASVIKFISNIRSNSDIETVTIDQIEKKAEENNYSISFRVTFKDSLTKI